MNARANINPVELMSLMNSMRRVESMFPGYFPEAKHNHYSDFGFPTNITFDMFYGTYRRNGIAFAAVDKTVKKTWEKAPEIIENDDPQATADEKAITKAFRKLRLWRAFAEADRASLVGGYGALIFRFKDGKTFDQPVGQLQGLQSLAEVIPAWKGQLKVLTIEGNLSSENYGKPSMFQFDETVASNNRSGSPSLSRSFSVHPDRVLIWSDDGTVNCSSRLEPGYNDLMTIEKINGAGGAGFWKNAKSAPVLQVDKDAKLKDMAKAMNVPESELLEAMNEQVNDWQKGFEKLLMLQGIEAKAMNVTLPSPEPFLLGPVQSFASSFDIPLKILVGNQNGERASTEDAKSWNQAVTNRRETVALPLIEAFVDRMVAFRVLAAKEWTLDWADLSEATMEEKVNKAKGMAEINTKSYETGEIVFLPEEIRAVMDYEPLSEDESDIDKGDQGDGSDDLPDPKAEEDPDPNAGEEPQNK